MYMAFEGMLIGLSRCLSTFCSVRRVVPVLICLAPHFTEGATVVHTPVATQTVQWTYTGTWESSVKEGLFVQGIRENTVAQAFFLLPAFDWAEIKSVALQITIPATYSGRSISYTKIYATAGDPIGKGPGQQLPGRSLLYSYNPYSKTSTAMQFDLTAALRNSEVPVANGGTFRFDFTTYVDNSTAPIPISQMALIVNSVPEPSAASLALAAIALLSLSRGRRQVA